MKRYYLFALAIIAALIAFPLILLSKDAGEKHTGKTVYHLLLAGDIKSIDPATCSDEVSNVIQAGIYEGLYAYHYLKRPLEVVPLLAQSMPEISADGMTFTIHLKPGIRYHRNSCFGKDPTGEHQWNTRTVTAHDFVLAFKRIADYHINTGMAWAFAANRIVGLDAYREKTRLYRIGDYSRYDLEVEGLEAPDSLTLRIRLVAPYPQFIYVLALHLFAPFPREVVDYWLTSESYGRGGRRPLPVHERHPEIMEPEQVVGTGPYLLHEMKRKWKIRLVRNPEFRSEYYPCEGEGPSKDYPGDSAMGLLTDADKRIPFIDEVNYRYVDEQYTAWMLFLSKQVDAAGIPRETFNAVVRPDKKLTDEWSKRNIKLARFYDPSIFWMAFNMEDPLLGRCKTLRQAICLGYDVESEISVLLSGRGKRAVNIIPTDIKGHDEAGSGPYTRYDLAAAKEKVAQAKKELGVMGLLVNGEIPELKIDLSDGVSAQRLAEFTRQQFSNMGLRVKTVFNDWPTLQRKVHNNQVQMHQMGWSADYPDAENFLQNFYSGNIDKGTNTTNYRNPRFDSLYERVRIMQDSPERMAMYVEMIRMISEDCPVLFYYERENFSLFHEWVHNVKPHPIAYNFIKYRRIDTALRAARGGEN